MQRTLLISSGEKLSLKDNWLTVTMEDGKTKSLPIPDLYCVVIDNGHLSVSVPLLSALAENKVNVIFCDKRHLPSSEFYPLNQNYHVLHVLKKQINMSDSFIGALWKRIIQQKIKNQAICLDNAFAERPAVELLQSYTKDVKDNDEGCLESLAARVFFKHMYSSSFHRFDDDPINHALNYGYSILRSCMTKSLSAYGFNCALGIHHHSELNNFNLADDLMEPFRPLVDQCVASHLNLFQEGLTRDNRLLLIDLVNSQVLFRNRKTRVRTAFDQCAKSLVSAIELENALRLSLPELISEDIL